MSLCVSLVHQTCYHYDSPVYLSPHLFRLRPAAHSSVQPHEYALTIQPENHALHWHQDPFGNFIARVDFTGPVIFLSAEVSFIAEIREFDPFNFFLEDYAQTFPFEYEATLKKGLNPYFEITEEGPFLLDFLAGVAGQQQTGIIDFLVRLNQQVYDQIRYTVRLEPGVQSGEESLLYASGSCRDSAWLLVQLLRHLHLASRFVSGYLLETGEYLNDRLSLHAWAEVYLPGAGWIGLDPSSGLFAGPGHIPLACTPGPENAAPVSGTTGPCQATLSFNSSVRRLSE